jgi:hypothetical protein
MQIRVKTDRYYVQYEQLLKSRILCGCGFRFHVDVVPDPVEVVPNLVDVVPDHQKNLSKEELQCLKLISSWGCPQ